MKVLAKLKAEPGLWMSTEAKPIPKRNEVLIKIKKTAICGTDLHIYKWDDWAKATVPVPLRTGHEFVGEIVEVGEDVQHFKVGDRVSGEGHLTCGECRNCRAGNRHLCRHTRGIGYHVPGVFAEYFALQESNVFKVPAEISDDCAAIFDPFGNATYAALENDLVGEDVLVTGAGPVGLMAAAICQFAGARHVVITDVNEYRLNLARNMGLYAVNSQEKSLQAVMQALGMQEGFDVGIELSGSPHAFSDMISAMNYGGKISFMGIPSQPYAINWGDVVFKTLTIKGLYGRRIFETWYKMAAMLQSGLNIAPVITHHFKVDDFQKGFDVMLSGEAGKVILDWEA
jgi:threonine 3-dehydrogenase